jgi:hypothetical protein
VPRPCSDVETPEILSRDRDAVAEDFHSLPAGRGAADSAIGQVRDGSVGESEARDQIVLANRMRFTRWQRERAHGDRFGVEQPVHQVDEVTRLAQNGAADRRVRHPVRAGNAGRVDPAVHNDG